MADGGETPEQVALVKMLDVQREALIGRLDGLSAADVRRTPTVSALSLLGLVKHSAYWERGWFQLCLAGWHREDWPGLDDEDLNTFTLTDDDSIESVVATYRTNIAVSNEIVMTFDLETLCAFPEVADSNLRWVALHMIEETARHAGHADIIRETIDGTRGR